MTCEGGRDGNQQKSSQKEVSSQPTSSVLTIRDTSEGWNLVPLSVVIPEEFRTSQIPLRTFPDDEGNDHVVDLLTVLTVFLLLPLHQTFEVPSGCSEFHSSLLQGLETRLRSLTDEVPLLFRQTGIDVELELGGVGNGRNDQFQVFVLHQFGNETYFSGKTVEFGDDQDSLHLLHQLDRLEEFRSGVV